MHMVQNSKVSEEQSMRECLLPFFFLSPGQPIPLPRSIHCHAFLDPCKVFCEYPYFGNSMTLASNVLHKFSCLKSNRVKTVLDF